MGDLALGRISAWHYDYNHKSKMNEDFVKAFNAEFKRNPDFFAVGGYDGMHLIYEALKKTKRQGRRRRADRRRQGHEVGKPARPDLDRSGQPATSCRPSTSARSRRSAASYVNVEFDKVENVKDSDAQ